MTCFYKTIGSSDQKHSVRKKEREKKLLRDIIDGNKFIQTGPRGKL